MNFSLFHATGSLPTTFIWEFWAIQYLHTQHSVPVSCTINRIFWLVHYDIIMQHEPMQCPLFKLILQLNFSIFDVLCLFPIVLRMNPWGLKHAEDIKNWKTELKHIFETWAFCWFMLHNKILTLWPKKTNFPLDDPYRPAVWW